MSCLLLDAFHITIVHNGLANETYSVHIVVMMVVVMLMLVMMMVVVMVWVVVMEVVVMVMVRNLSQTCVSSPCRCVRLRLM